jgi:hypothetical protein
MPGWGIWNLWYTTIQGKRYPGKCLTPDARVSAKKIIDKARQRTHLQVLDKLTDIVDAEKLFQGRCTRLL